MARIRQGEIWWAELPQPLRRRPVLILTRSKIIARLTTVTVAPLTRTTHDIDSEVVLSPEHGVPELCAVSLDNIFTIAKSRIDRRIVRVSADVMNEVFEAIRFAFDMP